VNGTQRYSRPAIWLHWIVAALMLVNVGLGFYAQFAPDDWARPIIDAHKSVGITVLGLAVLRLSWRISHPPPPLPRRYRPWERVAAHAVHGALYALIFALPLTGWAHDSAWKGLPEHPMRWFGLIHVPPIGVLANLPLSEKDHWHDLLFTAHQSAGYILYALVLLHVVAALKHQFFDKEPEMQRMGVR
jgi:cytochrome b561